MIEIVKYVFAYTFALISYLLAVLLMIINNVNIVHMVFISVLISMGIIAIYDMTK